MTNKYLLRLDDASEYMDTEKWECIATLLDEYDIKPIFGIIPQNRDESLVGKYKRNPEFWEWVRGRIAKGWTPAMHGFDHRYVTADGGINPINRKSEFAGVPYEVQAQKLGDGYDILKRQGVESDIFFAPAHTFDVNTLLALRAATPIRVISDTVAYDVYKDGDFWFIPQQSWRVSWQPYRVVTFCYHPNTMREEDFAYLQTQLAVYRQRFVVYDASLLKDRKLDFMDRGSRWLYFKKAKLAVFLKHALGK